MNNLVWKTESAYDYPLLIKNLLVAPFVDNPQQEIVYRGTLRMTHRTFRQRVDRLAAGLQGLGVRPGDTVGVMEWDRATGTWSASSLFR
jgi:fatty-acyl-CoA synthase